MSTKPAKPSLRCRVFGHSPFAGTVLQDGEERISHIVCLRCGYDLFVSPGEARLRAELSAPPPLKMSYEKKEPRD